MPNNNEATELPTVAIEKEKQYPTVKLGKRLYEVKPLLWRDYKIRALELTRLQEEIRKHPRESTETLKATAACMEYAVYGHSDELRGDRDYIEANASMEQFQEAFAVISAAMGGK